jgi:hypothetical protein
MMIASERVGRPGRWIALAICAVMVGAPVAAQVGSVGNEPYLMELRTKKVMFRYTPGALDRATRLEDPMELMVGEVSSWTNQPAALLIVLLSREEWGQVGVGVTYGLVGHLGPHDVVLPAWGDDQTIALWRDLLGHELPSPQDMPYGGSSLAYASLNMTDNAMFPAAAKVLLRKAGFVGDRPWVEGVAAHVVSLSIMRSGAPTRMPEARFFWQTAAESGGPGERLWLEASYFAAAWNIVATSGKSAGKDILKIARKNGNTITAANLLREYPSLGTWLVESFPPVPGPSR